ncbi:class I SAM-dependent methyltransferase [Phytohabitans aurantiacus]|jgi:hypothetical protein|uniref:Class I SAM-dependent methyltransferase n=1 Tax=Phytohabitans aurantiacus TaxID=3016789 RepID=A0ABQ5QW43_9ACTN|nr:class I SAM-dependent methyltransferase [Phytohabitans aurantiacus]GLH98477.1 hypothetical protein Pa4123_37520 [Phytohabitans aurantiacus]
MPPASEEYFRALGDRKDMLALLALAPLSPSYLPWSASAMRPSAIVALLNDIVVYRRRRVVELGGGISTFYIGRLLQQRGGHLWTVEHDADWAKLLCDELANEGLDAVVTVVVAVLAPIASEWPGEDAVWYERDTITKAIDGEPVDLLVVDGPPAYRPEWRHRRYPAVPFFAPMLADDYTVVLDDINRSGEEEILARWEGQLGITFERRLLDGTIGVGRSRKSFDV